LAAGDYGVVKFRLTNRQVNRANLSWYTVEYFNDNPNRGNLVILGGHTWYDYGGGTNYYVPIFRVIDYDYQSIADSEVARYIEKARDGTETLAGRRGFTKVKTRNSATLTKIVTYACDERIDKASG